MNSHRYILLFLFFSSLNTLAQIDAQSLMGLPVLTNDQMIDPTTTANAGTLIFNDTFKKVYEFNGAEWKQLLERPPTIHIKTGNYTATLLENNDVINFNSTTDVTLTLPEDLPLGYNISIYQLGNGKITIQGGGTAEVKNRLDKFQTSGEGAGVGVLQTAINVFHLTGDLRKK